MQINLVFLGNAIMSHQLVSVGGADFWICDKGMGVARFLIGGSSNSRSGICKHKNSDGLILPRHHRHLIEWQPPQIRDHIVIVFELAPLRSVPMRSTSAKVFLNRYAFQ